MIDIRAFIDNQEIRELNRNTVFSPMEQVVLIVHSHKTSVDEKLQALIELVKQYSYEEFQNCSIGYISKMDLGFKTITEKAIEQYNYALSYQYSNDNVIFGARLFEVDHPTEAASNTLFSTYEKAFGFITEEKRKFLVFEETKTVETKAVIDLIWLDQQGDGNAVTFYFDNHLILTNIFACFGDPGVWRPLQECCVYVPLPFVKGDILRSTNRKEDGTIVYGVLSHEVDDPSMIHYMRNCGDVSDMKVTMDIICAEQGRMDHTQWNYLDLERCPLEELPDDQWLLKTISELRKRNMHINISL